MCRQILLAYIGGWMTRPILKWNNYEIKVKHSERNIRSGIPIIPYFWDSDVIFDLVARPLKGKKMPNDVWNYFWELSDIEGHQIKNQHGSIDITYNRFRTLFGGY